MNYRIRITGSGTKIEILTALAALVMSVSLKEDVEGTYEDETLCTQIDEDTHKEDIENFLNKNKS